MPANAIFDASGGMPLFWQERKTPLSWKRLLGDVKGKVVCDLTPGSGTLARDCMEERILHFALCRTPVHVSWLINVCERHALRQLCTKGFPLFHQDLVTCMKNHFEDLSGRLHDQDNMPDTEEQEEATVVV